MFVFIKLSNYFLFFLAVMAEAEKIASNSDVSCIKSLINVLL